MTYLKPLSRSVQHREAGSIARLLPCHGSPRLLQGPILSPMPVWESMHLLRALKECHVSDDTRMAEHTLKEGAVQSRKGTRSVRRGLAEALHALCRVGRLAIPRTAAATPVPGDADQLTCLAIWLASPAPCASPRFPDLAKLASSASDDKEDRRGFLARPATRGIQKHGSGTGEGRGISTSNGRQDRQGRSGVSLLGLAHRDILELLVTAYGVPCCDKSLRPSPRSQKDEIEKPQPARADHEPCPGPWDSPSTHTSTNPSSGGHSSLSHAATRPLCLSLRTGSAKATLADGIGTIGTIGTGTHLQRATRRTRARPSSPIASGRR